ncbi:MAG: polysaccharide biosynthesis C-terminal domain-containing protein [Monoglobales bacterium]
MSKKEKQASFMGNVSIILFAQLMVKILGMVYRMVITNIDGFGDSGNGFYTAGFQVYTVLLAISSVGIPNAIAKLVAERAALDDYRGAHKIFKTAFVLFAVIGAVCSAILYLGADFIAVHIVNMDGVQYVMRALSPSIFFVCVSSVIRGYFQGLNDMNATSRSQIYEQVFKCTLTIAFVMLTVDSMPYIMQLLTRYTMLYSVPDGPTAPEIMAAWANAASSAATLLSFIYLIFFYMKKKKGIAEKIRQSAVSSLQESAGKLMWTIISLSVPISLASIITAINRVVDTATITRGIELAFAACIPAHGSTPAIFNPSLSQLNDEAVRLAGMLSKSDTLINMPLALNVAFATVLVPTISSAVARGDKKEASDKISYSFLISTLIILPCCIGYIVLAKPIYMIIYPNAPLGYDLLALMAVSLIFSALSQTISGSLQGIGKVFVPAIGLIFGCIIKVILNLLLIRIPSINIYGAAISSIMCQIVSFLIVFFIMTKYVKINITVSKYILKPLISGIIMGIAAIGVYKLMMLILGAGFIANLIANLIATLISIAVAAVVYFGLIFVLHVLNEHEVKQLPGGNALCRMLVKLRIYD